MLSHTPAAPVGGLPDPRGPGPLTMTPTRTAAAGAVIALLFALPSFAQSATQSFQFDSCQYRDGPHTLTINGFSTSAYVGSNSITVNVVNRPTASFSYPIDGQKVAGQVTITGVSYSRCSCLHSLKIDGKVVATGPCGTLAYQWFATKAGKGKHTIILTATNSSGDSAVAQITVTV